MILDTAEKIGHAMFKGEMEPMTKDQSKLFLTLCFVERIGNDHVDAVDAFDAMKGSMGYQILDKRLSYHFGEDVKVATESVKLLITGLCDRPGTIVMYAAALGTIYKETGKTVNFDSLCDIGYFANGFPTEDALEKIWDAQKNGGANWIDTQSAWDCFKEEKLN